MALSNASTIILFCLAFRTYFCNGSVSVTRILNVGDNMTLDCVTDWDPDMNMYWVWRKLGSNQYLAQASTSYPTGEIYGKFRYDPRISISYYSFVNASSDRMSKILALSISNITEQDSAEYICFSANVLNNQIIYLYLYGIRVVTCNCSIDTNVRCDLIDFDSPQWLPVTTMFNGGTVKTVADGNRLEFSPEHVNDLAIAHSIHVSSDDGLLSNITCILPAQSNPSSTQRTTTTVLTSQRRQSHSQQTVSPSTLTVKASLETSSERDESSITDMTTKPNTKRPSEFSIPQTEKTSKASNWTASSMLLSTTVTPVKAIKTVDHDISHDKMIIIALAVSLSVVVLIVTAITGLSIWRQALKSKCGRTDLGTIEDCSDSTDWVGSLS